MSSFTEPARIGITICGDGGCGKSSITLRLVRSVWTSSYDPTIEDSYTITRLVDGRPYLLSLTDTAGQEEYRGMWAGANMASDAFLMVYDITSSNTLDALNEFVDMVDMESETRQDHNADVLRKTKGQSGRRSKPKAGAPPPAADDIKSLPVKIIAGNKCDLQQSRQVDAKTGLDWARVRGCGFMETSARNEVNIEETFALIVRRVVEARRVAALERAHALGEDEGERRNGNVQGGLGGNRALPPQGLDFSLKRGGAEGRGQYQGVGTRRAVTAPLSPLEVLEKAEVDGDGNGRRGRGADRGRWRFRGTGTIGGRRKLKGLLCF